MGTSFTVCRGNGFRFNGNTAGVEISHGISARMAATNFLAQTRCERRSHVKHGESSMYKQRSLILQVNQACDFLAPNRAALNTVATELRQRERERERERERDTGGRTPELDDLDDL